MTTNHPAHGPVSLDRLHQIREILSKAAAQSDGGNLGYAMADAVKVIEGAIAAFGAEPVAWKAGSRAFVTRVVAEMYACEIMAEIQPLYITPPATVVRDDLLSMAASAIEDLLEHTDPSTSYYSGVWSDVPVKLRAAMLQAGNSPVIGIDLASEPDRSVEVRYLAPPGYVIVPIIPTEDMIINGFESVPDPHFSDEKEWEEYEALSGCRQAARRAELCWAAMIKAAPKQENI
ncbi:hypothetical protein HRR37_02515 [Cronobacter sakazakii]|uniref:DUF551 domain-containing protein n=1 Tax=Cronobacter sakazakii TaxID=28141 RepID=A0A853H8U3_CROSK|nr:hypothetical protein [Cronobacter sakazakii]NYV41294.1 hypothetical protein [Cronobacter sakazakii]